MSNNHPKHARNFTPHPINKHQRPVKPRFDATPKSNNIRSSPSHQDLNGSSKRSTQSSSNTQPELQEAIKSASSNPYSIGFNTFPKLPKFKLISKSKHDNKRPASANQPSPLATSSKAADVVKPPSNSPSRSSNILRHGPLLPRKPHQQAFPRPPWRSQQLSFSRPRCNIGDPFPTQNTRPEEDNVPDKSPKKKTRTIRRKKGAAVSTEPTKTRRTGHTAGNGQTAGGVSLAEDEHEDTDEELYRIERSISRPNTTSSISDFAPRNRFGFSTAPIENDRALDATPSLDKMVTEPSHIPGLPPCPAKKVMEGTLIPGLAGSSAKIVIGGPARAPTTRPTCPNEMGIETTAPVPTRATSPIKMTSPPSSEKTATKESASNPSAVKMMEEKSVPSLGNTPSPSKITAKATAPLASKPLTAHSTTAQKPLTLLSPANVKQASKILKPSGPEILQEDRHDTSSLSSISSEPDAEVSSEQDSESSASEGSSSEADSPLPFHTIQWQAPLPTLEEEQNLFPDLVNELESFHHHQVVETAEQAGIIPPPPSPAPEILMDEASELGEDVCLEYTDFGECHEMGVPVTWSESDYGEREESEGTDEFAELLSMEASDEKMMEINKLVQESAEPHSSDTEFFEYDGLFSDSSTSYAAIQDFEPIITTLKTEEEATVEEGKERDSNEESDGDTTDSLDEDDHSGLVRFGIEADDDDAEEDDSTFFDLPPDSALGSLLTNLERSGDVEFFVLPEDPAPSQQSIAPACLLPPTGHVSMGPAPQRATETTSMGSIQLPLMGSFAIGSSAGRTIIDGKAVPPPSPFTGTKVIRYNRFKKLRDRSCAGDSELSSLGTPKADSQAGSLAAHPAELSAAEEEFDITAFIREDEDIDDRGEPAEAGCGDVTMKDLSKWRRVPMSAFRRNMMAASCSGWISEPVFDGAIIQPSRHATVGHNLSYVQERKQHARTLLMSPGHKRRRRRRTSKQPIGMAVGNLGGGTEGSRGDGTRLEHHIGVGLIEKEFDTPLFKSVMTEMGNHDMPMLNLMDGIEGLPIE